MAHETEWSEGRRPLYTPEAKHERCYWRRVAFVILGVLALALAAGYALALPRVANQQECTWVADIVIVAASLHKAGVAPTKGAAVLDNTYAEVLGGAEAKKWRELLDAAVRFVARPEAVGISPVDLASAVSEGCHEARGNLDAIFGGDPA